MVKTSTADLQKAVWNEEEDEKLVPYPSKQRGTGNWSASLKRSSGQRRSGKSSRERWSTTNQKTDPKLKSFTPQEEELVIQLHAVLGSRWPIIALQIPEKTENDVKFLWNSKLKKKLSAMGIDPVTHKPFSQILADYGNMGAFPKARTRLASLSRDLKSAFVFKHEQPQTEEVKAELYSQLEAINLVTGASKQQQQQQHYMTNECLSSSPPESGATSFSWSDFFLEEAFTVQDQNGGQFGQCDDEISQVKNNNIDGDDDGGGSDRVVMVDASSSISSSSSNTAFVEAMIGKQDEMCSQLPCFYEEPFYY